jgi:hypothetical protein
MHGRNIPLKPDAVRVHVLCTGKVFLLSYHASGFYRITFRHAIYEVPEHPIARLI